MSFRKKAQKKPLTGLRDVGQDITPESSQLCQGCGNGSVLTRLHGYLVCGQEMGREDPRGNTEGKKASHLMASPDHREWEKYPHRNRRRSHGKA